MLEKEDVKIILELLKRTNIQGAEVNTFILIVNKLNAMLIPKPKEEKNERPTGSEEKPASEQETGK